MEDFKKRLVEEDAELNEKMTKLKNFIGSDEFSKIDDKQKPLLKLQLAVMNAYKRCLEQRISIK